jgi:hypothetical protein
MLCRNKDCFRRQKLAAETIIKLLKPGIIDPAIQKHNELRLIKAREPKILLIRAGVSEVGRVEHTLAPEGGPPDLC